MTIAISTFYKFVAIADCEALRTSLLEVCRANAIKGTILIAHEGINATVSGPPEAVAALHADLKADPRFNDLTSKDSDASDHPFERLKIKIKPVVTFGAPDANPSQRVGRHVKPENWNALISDPDVVLVDTRNVYEVAVGTFANARNPQTRSFREFPNYVDRELADAKNKKVAMFCTGGIRCEKASSYLLNQGFRDVYHLEGGVLKYLESVPPDESLWQGECFVFDARVALDHGAVEGTHTLCARCGYPIAKTDDAEPLCAKCASVSTPATPASRRSS